MIQYTPLYQQHLHVHCIPYAQIHAVLFMMFVVWISQAIDDNASSTLKANVPMGKYYQAVLPQLCEDQYSNPGEAFLQTIGHERNG